nr:phospholipase-like protein [Tanacetum cinerariifolium]
MLCCKHEKLIVEENRFRLDEAKSLRLEEENMLQLEEQKKNKRKELINSSHGKNILAKLAPAKRNQLCSSSEKINPKVSCVKINKYRQHVNDPCTAKLLKNMKPWGEDISRVLHCMDTVWLSDDIDRFLGQPGQVKCKFPWNVVYIVDRNLWLKLVCFDPTRKGWLTEELLLQKGLPLFYANKERYTVPWSEVDQVFILINETGEHWCLVEFHILSREITFYDTGYTYEYDYRDWLAHGLSLDVDDPVDVALAYREKMKPPFSCMEHIKRIDDSTEKYSLFEVNYGGTEILVKNLYVDFLHVECVDDHFDPLDYYKYEDVYGGGCFDVGGSFKGFDWIDERVGSDDRSLLGRVKMNFQMMVKFTRMRAIIKRSKMLSLRKYVISNYGKLVIVIGLNEDVGDDDLKDTGKSKDEFSNNVILDDVVSSPTTTVIGLNEVVGDNDLKDTMTALWVETASMNNDSRVDVSSLGGLGTQFHRQRFSSFTSAICAKSN